VALEADDPGHKVDGPPIDSQLELIADAIQRIGGGLAAMGPYAVQQLSAATGSVSLSQRLTALVAGVTALEADLSAMRSPFMASQMQQLGLDGKSKGLKLHLGCGGARLPGWVNIDAYPAELSMDLRWGLPFEAGSVDHVFMSHVFEHLYHPEESSVVLKHIHRVLSPGGRLRLIVPDIELCIRAYCENDAAFMANRQHTWTWWPKAATRLEDFLAYAGAGPRASHFLEGHKFGYDFETLAQALTAAGFTNVERSSYMGSKDPVLQIDTASSVAGAHSDGTYYSLFVEAEK
jgi:SAM-dependent methyltransferase